MISVSDEIKAKFESGRQSHLAIFVSDGTVLTEENIVQKSMELEQTLCDESSLTFGNCTSASFKIQITNYPVKTYKGLTLKPYLYFLPEEEIIPDPNERLAEINTLEYELYFPLGEFYVDKEEVTDDKMFKDITAYDLMTSLYNIDVTDWYNSLPSKTTMYRFRNSLFNYIGVDQVDFELANDDMTIVKNSDIGRISFGTIIQDICELNGCFGTINLFGQFKYTFVTDCSGPYPRDDLYPSDDLYPTDVSQILVVGADEIKQGGFTHEDFSTERISGAKIYITSQSYYGEAGSEGNVYEIRDNILTRGLTQSQINLAAENFLRAARMAKYIPSSVEVIGRPWVELGDYVRVYTDNHVSYMPILHRTMTGPEFLRDTLEAKGEKTTASTINNTETKIKQLVSRRLKLVETNEEFSAELSKKVGDDEVIASINQSAESIKIKANKVNLSGRVTVSSLTGDGTTTVNGSHFQTGTISDQKGNTSFNLETGAFTSKNLAITSDNFQLTSSGVITAKNVTLTGGTLTLTNGAKIIGTDGIATILKFNNLDSSGKLTNYTRSFSFLGIRNPMGYSSSSSVSFVYSDCIMDFNIPDNFEIQSAKLVVEFASARFEHIYRNNVVKYWHVVLSTGYTGIGYPKDVKIGFSNDYAPKTRSNWASNMGDKYINPYGKYVYGNNGTITYLSNPWGTGSATYTPSGISSSTSAIDRVEIDGSKFISHIHTGSNHIILRVGTSLPTTIDQAGYTQAEKNTGLARMTLYILGYLKV